MLILDANLYLSDDSFSGELCIDTRSVYRVSGLGVVSCPLSYEDNTLPLVP